MQKSLALLALAFAMLLPQATRAATPTFSSFSTNDFIVVTNPSPYVIHSNRTNSGGSNVFVNTTIINTNTIITNVNTTIVNTNVTQVIDNSTTTITNSYITITNTIININGNTNFDAAFLWTNNAGLLMPVNPLLPVVITNTLTANEGFFYGTNAVSMEAAGPISLQGLTNRIGDNGTTVTYNGVPIGASKWTNDLGILHPIDLTLPLMFTNQIQFGPGITNVLYRLGSGYVITNGAANWQMDWLAGDGTGMRLKLNDGAGRSLWKGVGGTGAVGFGIDGSTHGVIFQGTSWLPLEDNVENLSTANSTVWWKDLALRGTAYISGYDDHAGNYSRLTISQVSSNTPIVFNVQSAGTAAATGQLVITNADVYLPQNIYSLNQKIKSTPSYYTNIIATNLASGNNDIWTVPSGFKAVPVGFLCATTNDSSSNAHVALKSGGNYYQLGNNGAATTNATASLNFSAFVFEQGDTVAINSALTGTRVRATFQMLPMSDPLKTYRLLSISSGANTFHTATVTETSPLRSGLLSQVGVILYVSQESGGPLIYGFQVNDFLTHTNKSVTSGILQPINLDQNVVGDVIKINSNSSDATQAAWMTVFEVP